MISVAEQDREVLQFLWFNDVMKEYPNMIELQFSCVVFGVSSSTSQCHNRASPGEISHYQPRMVTPISCSIYVNDVVFGAENEEHAYKLYQESKKRLIQPEKVHHLSTLTASSN